MCNQGDARYLDYVLRLHDILKMFRLLDWIRSHPDKPFPLSVYSLGQNVFWESVESENDSINFTKSKSGNGLSGCDKQLVSKELEIARETKTRIQSRRGNIFNILCRPSRFSCLLMNLKVFPPFFCTLQESRLPSRKCLFGKFRSFRRFEDSNS